MRIGMVTAAIFSMATAPVFAAEPNQTFATRTVLGPTIRTVADDLYAGSVPGPDTFLGVSTSIFSGFIYAVDDNSSPYGNGFASALEVIDVNSGGSIDFFVTGAGDEQFFGNHEETGEYEVIIDVYDEFGELYETVTDTRTLQPGAIQSHSYYDLFWDGGSYDVYIDNSTAVDGPSGGDVDFFTFTGLPAGAAFSVETFDTEFVNIDTILGWFDSSGALVEVNDDIDENTFLSKIEGIVPATKQLTFAVSGFGDDDFAGAHLDEGAYELRLSVGAAFAADFDGNGSVNSDDLATWRGAFGVNGNLAGNADNDNDTDGADFLVWQRERGNGPLQSTTAVPEPEALVVWVIALIGHSVALVRRRNSLPVDKDGCGRGSCR